MTKKNNDMIEVQGAKVSVITIEGDDYISLTDMLKAKDGDFFISDWLRNRNTVEFLQIWESMYNPSFNYGEFATIRNQVGLNNYKISVKEWVTKTNAIGLQAKAGRYGGTYAHKDIAFEFGMWIAPKFKLYLIREFDRLKQDELKQQSLEWNLSRTLAKINYKIHTDAVKEYLIPPELTKEQINQTYADEADVLNVALFGMKASEWRHTHPNEVTKGNIRDFAPLEHLIVLSNLESINAMLINDGLEQSERLIKLNNVARRQIMSLVNDGRIHGVASKQLLGN
jgi:hypothetical protein